VLHNDAKTYWLIVL